MKIIFSWSGFLFLKEILRKQAESNCKNTLHSELVMLPQTLKNVLIFFYSDWKHIFGSSSAFLLSSVPTDSSKHEV